MLVEIIRKNSFKKLPIIFKFTLEYQESPTNYQTFALWENIF